MKNIRILLLLFLSMFGLTAFSQNSSAYFLTEPSLSPDGQTIVFVYENDLWQVDVGGGVASRLTGMEGKESSPRFSPDGKWLAFSSNQNGNADVYVMPVGGGDIKQLTFHDGNDLVDSWAWDSKTIYFTSNRYNLASSYRVDIYGQTPARLFGDNYFNNAHHVVQVPGDLAYYFTESWESFMFSNRKRYKGDHNPNIKYFNAKQNAYKELTTYEGKDLWPTVDRLGKLYFASDKANGEYNLYTFDKNERKQLTFFETAIGRPQVSANGEKVVFTNNYQIRVFDTKTQKTYRPSIKIFKNENILTNSQEFNVQGKISNFDVSSDNKKIAFVSRGRLFVSDVKGTLVREMPTNKLERVVEVKWLKDNKTLLYTRTNKGWTNLFKISALNNAEEIALTKANRTERLVTLSPDKSKAVYISGSRHLCLFNFETLMVEELADDEFWFRGSKPRFSPDGKFIAYTAFRNFEPDVFIYDLRLRKAFNLTNTGVPEYSPVWSPDGKYIYITAARFAPGFPRGKGFHKFYRIPLYRFSKEFKSDKYDDLFTSKKSEDTVVDIKFELDNISERWESVVRITGEHFSPMIFKDKDKQILFFNSYSESGNPVFYKSEIKPFEKIKTKAIAQNDFSDLVKSKKQYYALIKGDIHKVNINGNKTEKIKISFGFNKNLNDEFVQMFYENWAALSENFYDENYHGVDWNKMKYRYQQYLPYIRNRENLRTLQTDMLGELNGSHLDFRTKGKEQKTFYKTKSIETGILFEDENPYKVKGFVSKSPIDILDNPIRPGDILVAVNGKEVNTDKNRNQYFTATSMSDEIVLSFKHRMRKYDVKIHPIDSRKVSDLLYDEWIMSKQKMVDKASDKRVAYVYMKNMGKKSLENFIIDMTTEAIHKDALILDLRYNRGGNVHDDVLQFLSQVPYMKWKFRDGTLTSQPNFTPAAKPIVLLINEHSLSDAEVTAEGFKQLKLGKIIGTETYRWIIFTSARGLVDGSYTRLPVWGCYKLNGDDLEKTGVAPDIYVRNTFMNRLNDTDPQLEKAIMEVMKQLDSK